MSTASRQFSNRATAAMVAAGIMLAAGAVAAATVTYDFSSLPTGTTYGVGDVVTTPSSTIELKKFQYSDGTWTAGGQATVVASNLANGSPVKELQLANIMVRVIPNVPATAAHYRYADLGGNVNFGVNGDFRNVGDLIALDGTVVGGCDIMVTEVASPIGNRGMVMIAPRPGIAIERFGVGGQEFWVDDVTHDW